MQFRKNSEPWHYFPGILERKGTTWSFAVEQMTMCISEIVFYLCTRMFHALQKPHSFACGFIEKFAEEICAFSDCLRTTCGV